MPWPDTLWALLPFDDVQDAWQQIRIPFFLCIVVSLALVRVYLHCTGDPPELHAFPQRYARDSFQTKQESVAEADAAADVHTTAQKQSGSQRIGGSRVKRRNGT